MNETTSYDAFQSAAVAEGFDQVLVREWDPHAVVGEHRHPFAVKAVVARGDFWLDCDGSSRLLRVGDGFELDTNVPHAERYGAEGATIWVARRHAPR